MKINRVYYVLSQDPYTNPIAIRPNLTSKLVWWEDTSRGKSVPYSLVILDGKEINASINEQIPEGLNPKRIDIVSENGEKYILNLLTLETFNSILRDHVAGGRSLHFSNDQDLQNYYLNTSFY